MAIIKKLKWGVYSTESGNKQIEMNVLENQTDLNKFIKAVDSTMMQNMWSKYIKEGDIILVHSNGFSWCTESPKDSTHPNSYIRLKLGELTK